MSSKIKCLICKDMGILYKSGMTGPNNWVYCSCNPKSKLFNDELIRKYKEQRKQELDRIWQSR